MKRLTTPGMRHIAVLLVALAVAAPASAQGLLTIRSEPGTPVVATEVLIATGPADEPIGQEGVGQLAARAVTLPIRPALDSLEARLEITMRKDAIGFRLIAAPDAWPEAVRLLMLGLFRDPVSAAAVEAERSAIQAELLGRRGNPADAAIRAADAAFYGEDHPWGRSGVGEPSTVGALTHRQTDEFLRANFRPERAVAAVVGPVEVDDARAHLLPYLEGSKTTAATRELEPRDPAPSPVHVEYNSVTTWVTVIFPFGPETDVEAVRLLAHLSGDALSFGPTRRSVYDSRAEVVQRADGGEVRLTVVVPPLEAEGWAGHITEVVGGLVDQPFIEEGWEAQLRRYRGERLDQLAAPEDRAAELARALLVSRATAAVLPDFEDLTVSRVREAVDGLGDPTVVLLGPRLDGQEADGD